MRRSRSKINLMKTVEPAGSTRQDVEAYERIQRKLERYYPGEWAVFHRGEIMRLFPNLEKATEWARNRYGETPVLIVKVGETVRLADDAGSRSPLALGRFQKSA